MSPRHWIVLPLLATLAAACGGDDAADLPDGSTDDTTALAAEEGVEAAGTPAADSIPMEITVTASEGQVDNNGTFVARGMGERCTYDPSVPPGVTRAAWNVVFFTDDTTGVQMLNLEVGAPVNDTTSAFALTLVAGTSTAAGITMPMRYMVGTWPGGAQLGSGTVTVQRTGDGARFDVNAIDGGSKTRLTMTATCARLGAVT